MEYLVAIGVAYIIGNKIFKEKSRVNYLNNQPKGQPQFHTSDHIRDDYVVARGSGGLTQFSPDFYQKDIIDRGIIMGDDAYENGPNTDTIHPFLDPDSWYHRGNAPPRKNRPNYLV